MANINKVILVGRLGKDPEAKQTRDGKEFSSFSVATSRKFKDEEKTTWHNVVVWNESTAKYCNSYARKGTLIYVEGEIDNRKYEKQDGTTGYASDVVVGAFGGNVQILADGTPRDREGEPARPATKPRRKPEAEPELDERKGWDDELNDEIPF